MTCSIVAVKILSFYSTKRKKTKQKNSKQALQCPPLNLICALFRTVKMRRATFQTAAVWYRETALSGRPAILPSPKLSAYRVVGARVLLVRRSGGVSASGRPLKAMMGLYFFLSFQCNKRIRIAAYETRF